jgi:hypothetical protein
VVSAHLLRQSLSKLQRLCSVGFGGAETTVDVFSLPFSPEPLDVVPNGGHVLFQTTSTAVDGVGGPQDHEDDDKCSHRDCYDFRHDAHLRPVGRAIVRNVCID